MVSNARLDLPEPDRPVITVSVSRGISTLTSFRLCSRAPRTLIWVSISFQLCSYAIGGRETRQRGPGEMGAGAAKDKLERDLIGEKANQNRPHLVRPLEDQV